MATFLVYFNVMFSSQFFILRVLFQAPGLLVFHSITFLNQ